MSSLMQKIGNGRLNEGDYIYLVCEGNILDSMLITKVSATKVCVDNEKKQSFYRDTHDNFVSPVDLSLMSPKYRYTVEPQNIHRLELYKAGLLKKIGDISKLKAETLRSILITMKGE